MATNTTDSPVPPVPNLQEIVEQRDGSNKVSVPWMQWFVQLREKINILNSSIVNLADLTGTGILTKNGASWLLRTITGTAGRVSVANGDGAAGNPVIDLVDTTVTPGSYSSANITVGADGRLTAASNGGGTGVILQVVNTTSNAFKSTTAVVSFSSIPTITDGADFPEMHTSITPQTATSKLLIELVISSTTNSGVSANRFFLIRDSGPNAFAGTIISIPVINNTMSCSITSILPSGSTSASTFYVRWGVAAGTGFINQSNGSVPVLGGIASASLTITEIA